MKNLRSMFILAAFSMLLGVAVTGCGNNTREETKNPPQVKQNKKED